MRLKTEIIDGDLYYNAQMLHHDAYMAHALIQAITEAGGLSSYRPVKFIVERADELLAEWGYGDDFN